MFTGLVEPMGTVRDVSNDGAGTRLRIEEPVIAKDLPVGASVAVNGVCLTVVDSDASTFSFEAGPETLKLTNLGELRPGMQVNLERALRVEIQASRFRRAMETLRARMEILARDQMCSMLARVPFSLDSRTKN